MPRAGSLCRCLALGLALSACEANVTPIEVGAGCPSEPERGPEQWVSNPDSRLIDDFEGADQFLPRVGGRDGAWILGSDDSFQHLEAESSAHCAARGARAGHFVGNGFRDWGANWTAVLQNVQSGVAAPYDATEYGAISFWAALGGEAREPASLPVGVTTLDVAWNGGVCTTCMDYYRTLVWLTPTWQRLVIRFDDLAQNGSGDPLVALRRDQLVGFIVWPERDFDVWLDDVRFEP
jgi:hypothetical protein